MYHLLLIIDVIIAICLITLILLQQGRGAEVGAAFGSGASNTVFGAQGSGNFLTRATAVLAALFFIISLSLGYLAAHRTKEKPLSDLVAPVTQTTEQAPVQQQSDIPAVPVE